MGWRFIDWLVAHSVHLLQKVLFFQNRHSRIARIRSFAQKLNPMSEFHALKIASTEALTPNSVALTFEITPDLKDTFSFTAGQYVTLKHEVNGAEVRRAYSISSSPSSGQITVGIKKVPNGTFSVYANEQLKAGDVLEVMVPEGRFVFEPNSSPKKCCCLCRGQWNYTYYEHCPNGFGVSSRKHICVGLWEPKS